MSEQAAGRGAICLGILRIAMGWTMVWAFMDKLFGLGFPSTHDVAMINGGSPTEYYLTYLVDGPFEGIWNSLAGNAVVDWLLMFGLILALMFALEVPPADNPLIDYHIIYIIAALAVYWLGGYGHLGLQGRWSELPIVRRLPILE